MVNEIRAGETASQNGPYIEELQEFLRSRGVPVGTGADLTRFADFIAQPGAIEEELGSLLRAFSYSEGERLGRTELLQLLTEAVSGADVETAVQENPAVLRPLFTFVNQALRPQRFWSSDLPEEGAGSSMNDDFAVLPPENQLPVAEVSLPDRRSRMEDLFVRAQELAAAQKERDHGRTGAVAGNPSEEGPQQARQAPEPASAANFAPSSPSREVLQSHLQETPGEQTSSPDVNAPHDPTPNGRRAPLEALPPATQEVATSPEYGARSGTESSQQRAPAKSLGQRWIIPVLAAGLAILGVGTYFARPSMQHSREVREVASPVADTASVPAASPCVAGMSGGTSRVALEERSRWAHRLLDGKLYSAALPEMQEIARLDPGFPGINLDESDALLHLQRLDEAQVAADAQIGIAECLARLPSTLLETYCSTQYATASTAGCRPQIAHLRQAAELQSALVRLEIDHGNDALPSSAEPKSKDAGRRKRATTVQERHMAPFPAATDDDNMVPAVPSPKGSSPE